MCATSPLLFTYWMVFESLRWNRSGSLNLLLSSAYNVSWKIWKLSGLGYTCQNIKNNWAKVKKSKPRNRRLLWRKLYRRSHWKILYIIQSLAVFLTKWWKKGSGENVKNFLGSFFLQQIPMRSLFRVKWALELRIRQWGIVYCGSHLQFMNWYEQKELPFDRYTRYVYNYE